MPPIMLKVLPLLLFFLFPLVSDASTLFEHDPGTFPDVGGGAGLTISGMSGNAVLIASTTPEIADITVVNGIRLYLSGGGSYDVQARLCETTEMFCHVNPGTSFNISSFSPTVSYTVPGYYTFEIPNWSRSSATSSVNVQFVRTSGSGVPVAGVTTGVFDTGSSVATPSVNTYVALAFDGFTDTVQPSLNPWIQVNNPKGGILLSATDFDVPYNFRINTGTTTADNLYVTFSSSKQLISPLSFPITDSGISIFSGTFDLLQLTDTILVTASLRTGTSTTYVVATSTFTTISSGNNYGTFEPDDYLIPPLIVEDCPLPSDPTIADYVFIGGCKFVFWLFVPDFTYIQNMVSAISTTSMPFFAVAQSAFTDVLNFAHTGTSSITDAGALEIRLQIEEADLDVVMFSPALLTQGMGTTTKNTFRSIASISLWIYGLYYLIVWFSAHITGVNIERSDRHGQPLIKY